MHAIARYVQIRINFASDASQIYQTIENTSQISVCMHGMHLQCANLIPSFPLDKNSILRISKTQESRSRSLEELVALPPWCPFNVVATAKLEHLFW